ncbi:bacterial transcriptional activator domain-containing protein [Mycobacterium avium]|uniref:Bacterial transcriptional activator domain-containing protein n=1 Tax=Mycobacterium avium TaxID=1764 RepID=A0A2A2ZBD6_MYCAV|nr:bacterial transcriptional activator domain-containing protein [Mycobacterium avium]MBZ4571553.1 hypothetical protein [Mycobacterium avium subsp. hominissuis]MCA2338260.1 bacterial transcriptional activator domain-containing protein [Mycobacterium avium]MDO2386485.1 bacterial transcriptional activator domain-containing protein [Mycobacterium avium subsp. hominissuis]PBA23713.1 hypothetical protein CKJ66_26890 [Mycobacterium avium]
MTAAVITPAELVSECLTGAARRLLGGVHSLTSSRVIVVRIDPNWIRVKFSAEPGRLPAPWEQDDEPGWLRAPRGSEPGLRDSSADPVLVVVGVGEHEVIAVNALAIDEIGVLCHGRAELIESWVLQAQIQGAEGDDQTLAGVRLSESPDATVVIADPLVDGAQPGWVDVLAAGTSWPVRPLRIPAETTVTPSDTPDQLVATEQEDRPADHVQAPAVSPTAGSTDGGDSTAITADFDSAPIEPRQDPTTQTAEPPAEDSTGNAEDPPPNGGLMTVFSRFEVTDSDGVALQPMQQQIIGAIALLQPITTTHLCELLYGPERQKQKSQKQKSFHVAMSKIRRRGLQPVATEDGYRIDLDSDWASFVSLVGSDPATSSTGNLARAAELVTGPLFGSEPPPWATEALPQMTTLVANVCRELAARHVEQPDTALAYARRGLAVAPGHQELGEIVSMLANGTWHQDSDRDVSA